MYEMDLTLDIHSDLCPMAVSAEPTAIATQSGAETLAAVTFARAHAVHGSSSEPCPVHAAGFATSPMLIAGG